MYKRECVKLGPSRERAEDWCSSALVLQLGQCKARPFNFVLVCWFFIFCMIEPSVQQAFR